MSFNTAVGRAEYVIGAGQNDYTFVFKVYDITDLVVSVSDSNAGTFVELIPTEYFVAINGDNGGTVSINVPLVTGGVVLLTRELPIDRTIEYSHGGDIAAATLNEDQDYQTYLLLDSSYAAMSSKMYHNKKGQENVSTEMPVPIPNFLLAWNKTGDALENVAGTADVNAPSVLYVDFISELSGISFDLHPTVIVREKGRGGTFNYDATQSGIDDGGIVFNGWVRQYNGNVYADFFGMKYDGTDESTIMHKSMDYCSEIYITNNINVVSSYKKNDEYPAIYSTTNLVNVSTIHNKIININLSTVTGQTTRQTVLANKQHRRSIAVAGVIRNKGTGWTFINDTDHQPMNMNLDEGDNAGTTTGGLEVTASGDIMFYHKGTGVYSMIVAPDETLASKGLICGASVGNDKSIISMYAPLHGKIDLATGNVNSIDTTIFPKDTISILDITDDGVISFTRPHDIAAPDTIVKYEPSTNSDRAKGIHLMYPKPDSGHWITHLYAPFQFRINGSANGSFTTHGSQTINNSQIVSTYDSATGVITVAFPMLPQHYLEIIPAITYKVGSLNPLINYGVTNVDSDKIQIRIKNIDGSAITDTNKVSFYINMGLNAKVSKANMKGAITISQPKCRIDAATFKVPYGNLWIYGMMQY